MIFLLVILVVFYFYIDCDFITLFYHLYRTKVSNKNDGYFGKTIWIVGASSGMGEYLTYEAVKNLAHCIIISGRRTNELERVKNECNKIDSNCKIVIKPLDLLEFGKGSQVCVEYISNEIINDSNLSDCEIDILVINSGVTQRGLGMITDLSVMRKLIDVNVIGVISLIQAFVGAFGSSNGSSNGKSKGKRKEKQKDGKIGSLLQMTKGKVGGETKSIFVTSSLGGKIGGPGQSFYCASKHCINGFLEAIKSELVSQNIHIGIICPGPIELTPSSLGGIGTDLNQESGRRQDNESQLKKGSKMKVERCAALYTTAITYNLSESWIANNPQLLFVYIKQYLPAITPLLFKIAGPMYMKKLLATKKDVKHGKIN